VIACYGLLLVTVAYLQPYGEATPTAFNPVVLHPGFTAIEAPYIIVIGVLILAIIAGAFGGSMRASFVFTLLLWMGSGLLGMIALLGIASIGLFLLPIVGMGMWAAIGQQ
jgi:hypothetical protein